VNDLVSDLVRSLVRSVVKASVVLNGGAHDDGVEEVQSMTVHTIFWAADVTLQV